MAAALLLWGFMALVLFLGNRQTRNIRRFVLHAVCLVIVFLGSGLFSRVFNYAVHGMFRAGAGKSEGLLCLFLYTADGEDAELFTGEEAEQRALFDAISEKQLERGVQMKFAPSDEGFVGRYWHLTESYDVIGYEIVRRELLEVIDRTLQLEQTARVIKMFEMEDSLLRPLLRKDKSSYLSVFAVNVLAGLVCSNTRMMPFLVLPSFLIYLFYVILFLCCVRLCPRDGEKACQRFYKDVLLFSFMTLSSVLIHTVLIAAVIYPQARYTTYSMALFYTALFLMLFATVKGQRLRHAV